MTSVGVPFVTVCFSIVRGAAARTITGFTKSVAEFILGSHAAVASVPPEAAAGRSPSQYLVSVVASKSGGYTSIRTIFVGRTVKQLLNWFTEHKVMHLLQRTSFTGLHLVRLEVPYFDNSGAAELVADGYLGHLCAAFDMHSVTRALLRMIEANPTSRYFACGAAPCGVKIQFENLYRCYSALLMDRAFER